MRTIHYLLTFIILLSVFSCQDEDILPVQNNEMPPFTNSTTRAIGITSGLTQDANGYWVASRRIPLVNIINDTPFGQCTRLERECCQYGGY